MAHHRRQFSRRDSNLSILLFDRHLRHTAAQLGQIDLVADKITQGVVDQHFFAALFVGHPRHRLEHMRVAADDNIYTQVRKQLRIFLLVIRHLVAVLRAPVRKDHHHIRMLARLGNVLPDLVLVHQIHQPGLVLGQVNAIGAVGVIQQSKGNIVLLIISNLVTIRLRGVGAQVHRLFMLAEIFQLFLHPGTAHIHSMIGGAGKNIKPGSNGGVANLPG